MDDNIVLNRKTYKIPPQNILNNHRKFYNLKAENAVVTGQWFERVFDHINDCDFPKGLEYILTDKFVCELSTEERENIDEGDLNWSIKCLLVSEEKNKNKKMKSTRSIF